MERINYLINNRVNRGTEENPNWVDNLFPKSLPYSEANMEIAKREAYGGDPELYDDGLPEPDTSTADDVLNALLGVTV